MDVVVGDVVLAALPGEDADGAPVLLADVVDVVVGDLVVSVDVLGARPVAGQQHADAADMVDLVADDADLLAVQVQADGRVAGVGELAVLDAHRSAPRNRTRAVGLSKHSQSCCSSPAGPAVPGVAIAVREA